MAADCSQGTVLKSIETLFRVGSVGTMSDTELIDLFLTRRDEAETAFEMLVRRHGPTVFGVCRAILSDPHEAEDAFQATFLVLARRASSIRRRPSMGSWLHGVARRVALRARTEAIKRRFHERRAAKRDDLAATASDLGSSSDFASDIARVLHEELGRLPEKYRHPVLLCDGEGLTHEHAARRLGWPVGTVSGRLSRARGILRDRLRRRGVEPCSLATGSAAVSSAMIGKTARAVLLFATQSRTSVALLDAAGTTLPAGAFSLAKGVLGAMSITRAITAGSIIVMVGVGFTTVGVGFLNAHGQNATAKVEEKPKQNLETAKPKESPYAAESTKASNQPAPKDELLKALREASKAAEGITPGDGFGTKAMTLVRIGEALANAGDRESAQKTYQSAVQSLMEEAALERTKAERSRDQEAMLAVSMHTDSLLISIIGSEANSRFIEEAADVAARIHDDRKQDTYLTELAKVKAQEGDIDAALRIGGKFSTTRSSRANLFEAIAHIQAFHYPKTDRSWVDKISEPEIKSRAYLGVAAGLAQTPYQQSMYSRAVRGGVGGAR